MMNARTRKTLAVVLQALASVGQRATAEAVGVSETTISRMKSEGDLQRFAQILTALGLKPVPVGAKCVSAERVEEIEREFANLRFWAEKGIATNRHSLLSEVPDVDTAINFESGR